jgi:cell division protein FtsB
MNRYAATARDNRDSDQMYDYLEARIHALKQRIAELEMDNEALRNPRGRLKPASKIFSGPMAASISELRHCG